MLRFLKRYSLWFVYAGFIVIAVTFGARESFLATDSDYALWKYVVLIVWISFVVYSIYATRCENFFKSVVTINKSYWGRQIGLDLYISVFLSLALIYLHEGSFVVLLLWLAPVLFFANLAILPYLILNFDSIVSRFL